MESLFYEMISKRKSFHLFRNCGDAKISEEELERIRHVWNDFSPLFPSVRTAIRIVSGEETTCKRGQEYCVLLYSERKDGYLQNIGYLGEQLDLYLVSENIGTLWFGIGKTEVPVFDGMDYVIMIAIRKIEDSSLFRKDMYKSKRKTTEEIWEGDHIDGVTNIVRFAPSACNTQPWIVKNNEKLSVYRCVKPGKRGIMPAERVSFYNQIDIGIFLCFLELCLEHQRIGFQKELFIDCSSEEGENLNAVYEIMNKM